MKTGVCASILFSGVLAAGACECVQAYDQGDFVLRLGHITVEPNEDSDTFAPALTTTRVGAGSDSGLGINFLYMVRDHVGVELLAASPFRHDIDARGPLAGADLGHIKHLPPTLSVLWFPAANDARVQPYIGGGINYTWIFGENLSSGAEALGLNDLQVRNSWGLAGRFGVDYMLDERWSLGAGAWYIDIDTEATVKAGATRLKADLELDPWVYMFGLGYTF